MHRLIRLLEKTLKPILQHYPKLYNFALACRQATKELLKPEPSISSLPNPIPGPEAYSSKSNFFPNWLLEEWRAISQFEPLLFPDKHTLDWIIVYEIPHSKVGEYYLHLYDLYGKNVSHTFIVPSLKSSEGQTALKYANTLKENHLSNNIVILSTEENNQLKNVSLSPGINCIEFGQFSHRLRMEEAELLLVRLLLQASPQVIHNFNSSLGNAIFIKYGPALLYNSKLFAFLSTTQDRLDRGCLVDSFRKLLNYYDYLSGITSDSQATLTWCHQTYALDWAKLFLLNHSNRSNYALKELVEQLKKLPNYAV